MKPKSHTNKGRKRKCLFALLDALFLFLLGLYVFAGRDAVPFHGDEATFIRMSQDYYYIIQKRDLPRVLFRSFEQVWDRIQVEEQFQRTLIGAIPPLTIGLAWDLAGMNQTILNGFWVWRVPREGAPPGVEAWDWHTWELNVEQGNVPDEQLLQVARTPSALLTVFSVFVVFEISRRLMRSRLVAWISTLVYVTTPAILLNGRRAMQEGAMLFFTSLVIYIALRAIQEQKRPRTSWRRLTGWYLLLGMVSGLAVASKYSSLIIATAAYLAVMMAPLLSPGDPAAGQKSSFSKRHVCAAVGSGLLSGAVFFCFTPVWWAWWTNVALLAGLAILCLSVGKEPGWWLWIVRGITIIALIGVTPTASNAGPALLKPAWTIVTTRQDVMSSQAELFGCMDTLGDRISTLLNELFFAGPKYYEVEEWGKFEEISEQIAAYETTWLDGRGGGVFGGVALIVLMGCGVWAMVAQWHGGETLLVILWLAVPAAILLATNILPWQRYYITLHAQLSVIVGLGARQIERTIAPLIPCVLRR